MTGSSWARFPDRLLTLATDSLFRTVCKVTKTDLHTFAATAAIEHHVGAIDWLLHPQTSTLWTLWMASLHVLVDKVDAFDDNLSSSIQHGLNQPRRIALIISRHNNDQITAFDFHNHTTSAARLRIFINRRSRSSRATAPKIRVPRGLPSLSTSTIALLSNRT